jgi:cobalt transporter subunit CbtB
MAQSNTAAASGNVATTALSIALLAFALLSVLFLLQENGLLLSPQAAHYLHEATHDARHALGVPCH